MTIKKSAVGRPKGTTKSKEEKRTLVSMRFSPEITDMVQRGIQLGAASNKTEFTERAIEFYYNALSGGGINKPSQEDTSGVMGQTQEGTNVSMESDFVDHIFQQWSAQNVSLTIVNQIFHRVIRLAQHLDAAEAATRAEPNGLTLNEFRLLLALRRSGVNGCMNPSMLKETLLVTPGAITRQVERLHKMGYVERTDDPEDRRSIKVCLTPAGFDLVSSITSNTSIDPHEVLREISNEEQLALNYILRKLLLLLEDDTK